VSLEDVIHRDRSGGAFACSLVYLCIMSGHGREEMKQRRGASYKQLGFVGHLAGLSKAERVEFYELARAIPLSEAHAAHLCDRLQGGGKHSNGGGW
jgi:hypothetical protein